MGGLQREPYAAYLPEIGMNVNRAQALRCAGYFGARLRAGKPLVPCGDAILIDPRRGFFAVGDSSDREPRAARRFMLSFSELLDDIPILASGAVVSEHQLEDVMQAIVQRSRTMLEEAPIKGTTTFTGVLLFGAEPARKAMLFHAGDSVLLAWHPRQGARWMTHKNFWLIGKTRHFYQAALFDVAPGERFLLASDGLQDLTPPAGQRIEVYLADLCATQAVEDIPDILLAGCDTKTFGRDDLALLALAPDRALPDAEAVILAE